MNGTERKREAEGEGGGRAEGRESMKEKKPGDLGAGLIETLQLSPLDFFLEWIPGAPWATPPGLHHCKVMRGKPHRFT